MSEEKVTQNIETEEHLLDELKKKFGDKILDSSYIKRPRRVFVDVKNDAYRNIITYMRDNWDAIHITTITGMDTGESFVLMYHLLAKKYKVMFTVRFTISRDKPSVKTITDILPGANLYEREVYDMLGIKFEGHPNLKRLLLPEDWPDGVYPLRKDFKREMGGIKNG